jgi:hypothetical protein
VVVEKPQTATAHPWIAVMERCRLHLSDRDLRSQSLPAPPRTVIPRLEKCLYCGACVVRQHTCDSTEGGHATSGPPWQLNMAVSGRRRQRA